jgi:hypothetical protein
MTSFHDIVRLESESSVREPTIYHNRGKHAAITPHMRFYFKIYLVKLSFRNTFNKSAIRVNSMRSSGVTCLPAERFFLASTIKMQLSLIGSRHHQSSLSHLNVTCYCHDIYIKLKQCSVGVKHTMSASCLVI